MVKSFYSAPALDKGLDIIELLALSSVPMTQAQIASHLNKSVNEICEYILRDMTSVEGPFYSAEDADSEGEEGVFYIWESSELKEIRSKTTPAFAKANKGIIPKAT